MPTINHHRQFIRYLPLLVVLISLAAINPARETKAEYEIPYVDSTASQGKVEFRSVWSYNRGTKLPSGLGSGTYEAFEAYAVGVDPTVTTTTNVDLDTTGSSPNVQPIKNNGVFYWYDGTTWRNMSRVVWKWPTMANGQPLANAVMPAMNAVVGQGNDGYGGPGYMLAAGENGLLWFMDNFISRPGDTGTAGQACAGTTNLFPGNNKVLRSYCNFFTQYTAPLTGENRDFYAVETNSQYGAQFYAGGQSDPGVGDSSNRRYGPIMAINQVLVRPNPAVWQEPTRENIVGIKMVDKDTVYILTSTFDVTATNDRYSVAARNCTNSASQKFRLYQLRNPTFSPTPNWTIKNNPDIVITTGFKFLGNIVFNDCAYGLTVAVKDQNSAGADGYPLNVIWIAGSKGIYKFEETTSTPAISMVTSSSKPLYSITSAVQQGGVGQNLLPNGQFNNWIGDGSTPYGWFKKDSPYSKHNPAKTCSTANNIDIRQKSDAVHGKYLEVWPGKPYKAAGCAVADAFSVGSGISDDQNAVINGAWRRKYIDTGTFIRLNLDSSQGQKFRISGKYKVTFEVPPQSENPDATVTTDPNTIDVPSFAEGGVSLSCGGNDQWNVEPRDIDCALKNRRFIKTYAQNSADNINESMSDWESFEFIISRQDLQIGSYYTFGTNGIYVTPRRMDMMINCEASYGARTLCDDITVEEITDPPLLSQRKVYVAAVGQNRTIISNPDGLSSTSNYSEEEQSAATAINTTEIEPNGIMASYQAVYSSSAQHVFVAGTLLSRDAGLIPQQPSVNFTNGTLTLMSRTPSSLMGRIWVGTNSQTLNPGQTNAGAGLISVSCINTKDSTTKQTLCQQRGDSYGWSLDIDRSTNPNTGVLSGRAWFGKETTGISDDSESINVGTCVRAPQGQTTASYPYNLDGVCDTRVRRCYATNQRSGTTTIQPHTNVSCVSDYDCYGRCSDDNGRLCVTNSDCQYNSTAAAISGSTKNLAGQPSSRLKCSPSNALSCSAFGWLSLDRADFTSTVVPTTSYAGEGFGVRFNAIYSTHNLQGSLESQAGAHELSGWGRMITLSTPAGFCSIDRTRNCNTANPCPSGTGTCQLADSHGNGWIRFRGSELSSYDASTDGVAVTIRSPRLIAGRLPAVDTVVTNRYLVSCQDCIGGTLETMNCAFCADAKKHSCVPANNVSNTGAGAKAPSATCHYLCDDAAHTACVVQNDCPSGSTCQPVGFCTGDMSKDCKINNDCREWGGYCQFGAICRADTTPAPTCALYGVNYSTATGSYYGSAWSEDFGWLQFNGVGRASSRFIQTQLGDIYAKGNIGNPSLSQPTGVNNCNATFLILAGGDIASNWCSALEYDASALPADSSVGAKQKNYTAINLPSSATYYQNALGRIDLDGIRIKTKSVGAQDYNKYGTPVVTITPKSDGTFGQEFSDAVGVDGILGGKVYRVTCPVGVDCSLDESLAFKPSTDLTTQGSGAGILYVEGNLKIIRNQSYASGGGDLTDLRQVASLVVIVQGGNLTIDNSVTKIVGSYYVLRGGTDGTTGGTIKTTSSGAGTELNPLEVRGLMMANNFEFGRRFAGTSERPAPSELIIFDGRLQSNPLPGLVDFSRILPSSVVQP